MLRKIRITVAAICFVAVTLLFLDFTGTLHLWFGWLAKIQFLPAVLALNFVVIAILLALTLLFGRIYCSVICPLGVFQDCVSNLSSRRKGKKARFSYSKEIKWLRYGVLVLFVIALAAGFNSLVALLAPYSAYGRMAQSLLAPVWQWGNNLLAWIAERQDSYAFVTKEVWLRSLPTLIVAAVTFFVVVVLAWRNGRTYCNTICPVGTTLSFFSRFARTSTRTTPFRNGFPSRNGSVLPLLIPDRRKNCIWKSSTAWRNRLACTWMHRSWTWKLNNSHSENAEEVPVLQDNLLIRC